MKNETKLTPADLALYLGCEAKCYNLEETGELTYEMTGKIISVSCDENIKRPVRVIKETYREYAYAIREIKPILRPLSDMTEDEEKEFVPLCAGSQIARFSRDQSGASNWRQWVVEFENGDVDHLVMNESGETWFRSYFESAESRRNWSNTVNQHQQTVWLLRHRFDIFEWTKSGLAIDKTKTTQP